jgi:hypothetical protein
MTADQRVASSRQEAAGGKKDCGHVDGQTIFIQAISDNSYDHSRLEKFKSYNSKTWSYKSYDRYRYYYLLS